MKKLIAGMLCIVMISGCTAKAPVETKGTAQSEPVDGNYVVVDVTLLDGKITNVSIDETYTPEGGEATTKKTLGADYGMVTKSSIGKEWFEQVEGLEAYIVENGVDIDWTSDAVKDDLKTIATINIDALVATTKTAVDDAK